MAIFKQGGGDYDDDSLPKVAGCTEKEPKNLIFGLLPRYGGRIPVITRRVEVELCDLDTGRGTGQRMLVEADEVKMIGSWKEISSMAVPIDPGRLDAEQIEESFTRR